MNREGAGCEDGRGSFICFLGVLRVLAVKNVCMNRGGAKGAKMGGFVDSLSWRSLRLGGEKTCV